MENIEKCECVIGIMYDFDNTDLITRKELEKNKVKRKKKILWR